MRVPDPLPDDIALAEGTYNFYIIREEGFKGLFGPVAVEVGDEAGIDGIETGLSGQETIIYDLTGARVARPEAGGVYIVRRGTEVFKVRY